MRKKQPEQTYEIDLETASLDDIANMISMITEVDPQAKEDETIKALCAYLSSLISYKEQLSECSDPLDFEKLLVQSDYESVYAAAQQMEDPLVAMNTFEDIDIQTMQQQIEDAILMYPQHNFTEDMFSPSRMLKYIEHRLHKEDERDTDSMKAAKHDILLQRERDKGQHDPHAEIQKGILSKFRSLKQFISAQNDQYIRMCKCCKTLKDFEIWYSRLTFGPAYDLAKQGLIYPLQCMMTLNEDDIRKEIAKYALTNGIECTEQDIDMNRVNSSTHTFSVRSTGFMLPECYLHSILKQCGQQG